MVKIVVVKYDSEGNEDKDEFETLMKFRVFVEKELYKSLHNGRIATIIIERREEDNDE